MDNGFQQNSTLTRRKALVIESIAVGATVTDAAEKAEVDRSTIYVWLRDDPDFKAEFDFARREPIEALRDRIRKTSGDAVRTVSELMKNEKVPPAIRLKAALAMIHSVLEKEEPNAIADMMQEWREDRRPASRLADL